jgi:hypothetical protein
MTNATYHLGKTYTHVLKNIGFDNLPTVQINDIFRDGRVFSHLIEPWLANEYNLTHIKGCKGYDFVDNSNPDIRIDEKTFTKGGLSFTPSNMKGQGRIFNREVFNEKARKLRYCCVSNINFPEIKIKFIDGTELLEEYPNGNIPLKDHVKFFD